MSDGAQTIKIGELPENLKFAIQKQLEPTMTCLTIRERGQAKLVQRGSGTMVRYRQEHGILTAAHVIDRLRREPEFCLTMPVGQGYISIKNETADFLVCDNAVFDESGPDIGFIRLSPHTVGILKSRLSFVDLETHKQKIENDCIPIDHGVWVETGFPEILGSSWRSGDNVTTKVFGMVALGDAEKLPDQAGFDYYKSHVTYGYGEGVPLTFRGLSGGGLWQVKLSHKEDGSLHATNRYLSGVVYYETERTDDYLYIRSHGRSSIYDYVVPQLIERA